MGPALAGTVDTVSTWTALSQLSSAGSREISGSIGSPVADAKILTLDIESAPAVADVWSLFGPFISLNQIHERKRMICWAAKWHGSKKVEFASEYHSTADDMVDELYHLMDEADVICGYNSARFDVPKINTEFVKRGYAPPSPFLQVDLIRTVRYQFQFTSSKLDNVLTELGLPNKIHHQGHSLWRECLDANVDEDTKRKAWNNMMKYNKQDVRATEALYDYVLPWIKGHPHVGLISGSRNDVCGRCGSLDLEKRGRKLTGISAYQQYRCRACGGWSRGKKALASVDVRPAN